ncbi:hypothetical protein MRB53_002282 [Persea americana]|uniref:Uncharacterized protein n=1 Tax=Persea americana TaxID=3435 RepID=A0ACC2MVP9_PERAE|nr:hypothetical protein MRB53_002282 [Persea americana]
MRVHEYNFDHPDAFDTEQLLCCMGKLRRWQAVDIPNYDFKSNKNSVFPKRRVVWLEKSSGGIYLSISAKEFHVVYVFHVLRNFFWQPRIFIDV